MISIFFVYIFLYFFVYNINAKYPYPQNDILKVTSDNIQSVFELNQYWLIKFYAPQCVHCKRIWNKIINLRYDIQNDNKRKVYFGEVNCEDTNGRAICDKYKVSGVPQLKLFKGSEIISTFSNDINNEPILKKWLYYTTTPIFHGIYSEEELNNYKTKDSLFLTCSENLNDNLIKVAKLYFEENYFLNIKNQELCTKLAIKDNSLHVQGAHDNFVSNINQMNFEELKHFANKNRFPLVSKIDHHSFFTIRSSGNNLILLLIDFQNEPDKYIDQFTQHAKRYINLKEYIFAYIDGKYYEEVIKKKEGNIDKINYYIKNNLELYGVDSKKYPQIIKYYFEDYFDIDHVQNIIEDIENELIKPKMEEFTKMDILLIKIKKQIKYIIDKSFRTDIKSFIGFICAIIMIVFTLVLVFHTAYSFVTKPESEYKMDEKKKK
ncbi:hypothetical protein YYE_02943 [Plasmodium vinckei vinckei]|nr:hypothetical protein YYE_02943 [Plasmodium vinckei vinckei]